MQYPVELKIAGFAVRSLLFLVQSKDLGHAVELKFTVDRTHSIVRG